MGLWIIFQSFGFKWPNDWEKVFFWLVYFYLFEGITNFTCYIWRALFLRSQKFFLFFPSDITHRTFTPCAIHLYMLVLICCVMIETQFKIPTDEIASNLYFKNTVLKICAESYGSIVHVNFQTFYSSFYIEP